MDLESSDFRFIRELVKERSAIVLDDGKEYLVVNRLEPLAKAENLDTLAALVRRLKNSPYGALHASVVEALTTNETSFFRDAKVFGVIEAQVVPELLQSCGNRKLRIWSAACSTGQEPYTLAIALSEGLKLDASRVEIVATDISRQVLDRAKSGEYTQLEVNRGLPAKLLVKYFKRSGAKWQVKDEIRAMVRFEHLNLIERWPPLGSWDLILLRNVLIYFDVETKRQILRGVHERLAPTGYLVLGTAETTLQVDDRYERIDFGAASAYRVRGQGVQGRAVLADPSV